MIGNLIKLIFGVALVLLAVVGTPEANAQATAEFSPSTARVGQRVELKFIIRGGSGRVQFPNGLELEGLTQIGQPGLSSHHSIVNGNVSQQVIVSVPVRPEREGEIVVPATEIIAGGQRFKTSPATLKVTAATRPSSPGTGGGNNALADEPDEPNEKKYGFVEFLVPKASAYEGELVPAEIRLYLNARNRYGRGGNPPEIKGQGFTTQRLTKPEESMERIDGEEYHVITFKTAISPAKAGDLTIGPVEIKWQAYVPTGRQRSPFGGMSPDPMFDQLMRNFGGLANDYEEMQLTLTSDPVQIEIKPLPKEGRPENFSGAVGNFAMSTAVSTKKADVGEPITITSRISGTGNFDRVTAPVIEDNASWKAYPPSANFTPDDDVGMSGVKTFETVVTAKDSQKATPGLSFSYFDPVAAKYVTLEGAPAPIQIVGTALTSKPSPTPQTSSPNSSATATPSPQLAPAAADILFIRTDFGDTDETFAPVWQRSSFVNFQWGAAGALLATILGFAIASRSRDQARQKTAALARDLGSTLSRLKQPQVTADEFYRAATHYLSVNAIIAGAEGNPDSAEEILAVRPMHEEAAREIEEIFRQRDALHYGGGAGELKVDEDVKKRVLTTLESYAKQKH